MSCLSEVVGSFAVLVSRHRSVHGSKMNLKITSYWWRAHTREIITGPFTDATGILSASEARKPQGDERTKDRTIPVSSTYLPDFQLVKSF